MLHLVYVIAFTIIAFITISNLIKSLITLSFTTSRRVSRQTSPRVAHPELLDDNGQPTSEPLLVIRSVNVEDARAQLDRLYQSSPEDFDS
jgi:Protein of unknown function (DUF2973)